MSSSVSSGSGILAMVASEKKRRRSSCHSSCCSSSWLPTRRMIAASLGKMPTTLVRRLISLLSRSSGLVLQILRQCSCGKCRNASTSSRAAHLIGGLDHEHCFHGGGHHVLARLGHVAQQVAQEVDPAPLPAASLEHALDRRRQAQVGIRDHQPGASCQATVKTGPAAYLIVAVQRAHRNPPSHGAVGPGRVAPAIAAALLADRGQQLVDRGAAHRHQRFPYRRLQRQAPVALERLHQQRQQRLQPHAVQPISRLPQRHQRLHHLGAIAPAMVRFGRLKQRSARLRCGHTSCTWKSLGSFLQNWVGLQVSYREKTSHIPAAQ